MVSVLDSVPLPWHDLRVQKLHEALTDAYPSGSKAGEVMSKVKGFPQHGVNWNHQGGASAIWRQVLTLAAQSAVLAGLLDRALDDRTIVAYHARIRTVVEEIKADADPVDESQSNALIPKTSPRLVKDPNYDSDPVERPDQITEWEPVVSGRCREALGCIVPAVMARPDLATESIEEAFAALRAIDVILNMLLVVAVAHVAEPLFYGRLNQAAESLRGNREAVSGTLRRLRRAHRPESACRLCDTLSDQAASLYTELESACSLLR